MSLTVFLTGATSGIGKATAEFLAENNYRLILAPILCDPKNGSVWRYE